MVAAARLDPDQVAIRTARADRHGINAVRHPAPGRNEYLAAKNRILKAVDRRQVHGEERARAIADLEDFLRDHAAGIAAMDFLVVPTVGFKLLFVLVILRHQRRRLISLTVTAHPTAEWIVGQITDAFPWDDAPDHLIRDRDESYCYAVTKGLSAMGIRDHPTSARSPWQNGHAEWVIGSIRRECLDHIVVFGEGHPPELICIKAIWRRGAIISGWESGAP